MTYAKVIADSMSPEGSRLTTMEVRFHRFVLAEFNTHRAFSRNSASSRAIPTVKQVKRVWDDPAMPVGWPAEQKGMQGGEEWEDPEVIAAFEQWWLEARDQSVKSAEMLRSAEVHKSVTNRLLEPFMWHTVIVTATDWDNFFEQRCSTLAQPEISAAAQMMRDAYYDSIPVSFKDRDWHLPYVEDKDLEALAQWVGVREDMYKQVIEEAKKVSAARCARVSYLTHDGTRDIQEDLRLYERLVTAEPPHWSPLEHVATPWAANVDSNFNLEFYGPTGYPDKRVFKSRRPRVGNLVGWRSLRTEFEAVPQP